MASCSYTVMVIIMAGITVAAIITAGGEADIADGDRNYLRQTSADVRSGQNR